MPHSLTKIWIHAIWATKERVPLLHQRVEQKVYHFMSNELRELGCPVRIVNGMPDHVHCLFLLSRERSIADVIKQIKGSSSHHINQTDIISQKFAWQTGYAAYSVSESAVEKVFQYIKKQKEHHRKKSSLLEYEEFLKLYGLEDKEG